MARSAVVIPGIGGHPLFHEHVVRAVGRNSEVTTAAHVDFDSAPCNDFEEHVHHWRRIAEDAIAGRPQTAIDLIGISYGAQLALTLNRMLPHDRLRSTVLVSYWPLRRVDRLALRAVRAVPNHVVGAMLFRWSERTADEASDLRRLRQELYDTETQVHARLRARLHSLAGGPEPPTNEEQLQLVYGQRELALLRLKVDRSITQQPYLVEGDHSISTGESLQLNQMLGDVLGYVDDKSLNAEKGVEPE